MKRVLFLISAAALAFSLTGFAQVAPGFPNFSTFDPHEIDTVDLLNNNVSLHIPIMSKPGTIPLRFSMDGNSNVYNPNGIWNASLAQSEMIGSANNFLQSGITNVPVTAQCPGGGSTIKYTNWIVIEANGTVRALPTNLYSDRTSSGTSCLSGSGFTAQTIDGSGITVTVAPNGSGPSSVILRDGTSVAVNQLVDAHGNTIILYAGVYTDSVGLSALTATNPNFGPFSWNDADPNHPGEIVCPGGMPYCTIWNALANMWDQYQGGNPTQDNRANALAQAINNTRVQTLQNPCTIGGFYAASAGLGALGVFGPPAATWVADNPLVILHWLLGRGMSGAFGRPTLGVMIHGAVLSAGAAYSACYD